MDKTDLTLDTYNKIAKDYEKNGLRYSAEEELQKFTAYIKPGGKILDAGCGFGRELEFFVQENFETYGIDGSKELLKLARKRAPQAKIQFVDLREKFPFESNFFDGVWARNSLHHLESIHLQHAFSEIRRVLKKDGILFIEWKEGKGEVITEEEYALGQKRFYNLHSIKDIEQLIEKAGFQIQEAYTYNWSERYEKVRAYSNFIAIIAKNTGT